MELEPPSYSRWQSSVWPSFTTEQKYWLFRPGALTAGLRQLGPVDLRVIREQAQGLPTSEAWMLERTPRSPIWVREIVMAINGVDCVFARSFTPLAASHSQWRGIRGLHTRPLADMLYHDAQITRSPFFVTRVTGQHPLYRSVHSVLRGQCPPARELLARCSVFLRGGQPLLVAECFMPEFWPLAADLNTALRRKEPLLQILQPE